MQRHEQRSDRKQRSVLGKKENISGLPTNKKSAVERARDNRAGNSECDSVLDGPACIEGVTEDDQKS